MMNQQAKELSRLIAQSNSGSTRLPHCRSVVISSGSGGVGRSLFALQTALSLGESGQNVILLDANAGVSHTALLAGKSQWKSLDDFGPGTSPDEVAIVLNERVRLVCGVAGWLDQGLTDRSASVLDHWLESADWCVIDAGPRTQPGVLSLLRESDVPVLVTIPEPIPLAETYAALRKLKELGCEKVSVVLNRVCDAAAGQRISRQLDETASKFLKQRTSVAATLLDDPAIQKAARTRTAGQFLGETVFGREIATWTRRLRTAA